MENTNTKIETYINYLKALLVRCETEDETEDDHLITDEIFKFIQTKYGMDDEFYIDFSNERGGMSQNEIYKDMIIKLEKWDTMYTLETLDEFILRDEFINVLNTWLEPDQIFEINKRNEQMRLEDGDDYSGCATHDFCDSNQAMLDAWYNLTGMFLPMFNGDEGNEVEAEKANVLVNAAWTIAKLNQFKKSTDEKN